jgi:hypothetical protein
MQKAKGLLNAEDTIYSHLHMQMGKCFRSGVFSSHFFLVRADEINTVTLHIKDAFQQIEKVAAIRLSQTLAPVLW